MATARRYREDSPRLHETLSSLEYAMESALAVAREKYPKDGLCLVRTKRHGYAAHESVGVVVGVMVDVHVYCAEPWASLTVTVRSRKTGKLRKFYPSIEVDGLPAVRMIE